jgi:hypothetical protein
VSDLSLFLLGWVALNCRVPIMRMSREIEALLKREEFLEQYDLGGEG